MIKVNGVVVPVTMFPDKTSQVWKLPIECFESKSRLSVTWDFEHEGELMHLAQTVDLLRGAGLGQQIDLYLPYLPYGRQDKAITNQSTFALHSFARMLNALAFDRVFLTDPHSAVAKELINNCYVTYQFMVLDKARGELRPTLVFPDKGAADKYVPIFCPDVYIRCEKIRDQATGEILKQEFVIHKPREKLLSTLHEHLPALGPLLIVDDICDGGATFIGIAKGLREAGAQSVHLFVSHGLFTKGVQVLRDAGIERIFTKEGEVE